MSKARELAELSRTVSDSADATAITINSDEEVTFASGVTVTGALSATGTSVFASLDISGDIDVDGTTNLDIVDIDGAVDMASTLAVGGNTTILPSSDGDALIVGKSGGSNLHFFSNAGASLITNAAGAGAARDGFQITSGNVLTEIDTVPKLSVSAAEVVVNDTGADTDFRAESVGNANALFVDASSNHIGMGTATLNRSGLGADHIVLTVGADSQMGMLELQGTRTSDADLGRISFLNAGTRRAEIVAARIDADTSTKLYFQTSNSGSLGTRLTIGKDGAATFNSTVTGGAASFTTVGAGTSTNLYAGVDFYTGSTSESQGGLGIYNATDGVGYVLFGDGAGSDAYRGQISYSHATDAMAFGISGMAKVVDITPAEIVMNQSSQDMDFRVESVGNANGLMLDASTSTVGVNRAASAGVGLSVNATATNSSTYAFEACNSSSNTKFIVRSDGYSGFYKSSNAGGFIHNTNGAITITPDAGGHFVFNEDGSDADFRVETNGADSAFFVDGSTNNIGIQSGTEWAIVGGGNGTSSSGSSIDMGYDATIYGGSAYWAGGLDIGTNFWRDASGYHYKRTSRQATAYQQNSQGGSHSFYSQTSGNAGAVISWNNLLYMDRSQTFFNDTGADTDFRVESDTESNAFTVDGGTGQVGVGSRSGFRFGNGSLQGNAGSSGGGYPVIGYNIRFQGTGGQYGTLVADTSWRMDIGDNNRLTVHSRSATAAVTGAATYTSGPYVALNGTSWTSGSDARLKENVNTITGAIDKVKAMRPVNYTWIHDGEGASNQVGFIAQEMALVVPEVVDIPEDDEVHLGIQYEKLVPVLTAALQEALTKIENLEARIAALES